jgi:hypothetical protein
MKKVFKILSVVLLLFIGLFGCDVLENIPEIKDPIVDNNDPINEEQPNNDTEEDPIEEQPTEDPIEEIPVEEEPVEEPKEEIIDEDGIFTSRDEVALYIYVYGKLPKNYLKKAQVKGHISDYYTKDNKLSIGGDIFYNREGLLPNKSGRIYYEADINYSGQSNRGRERIVFSNDGLIFYTDDHYESFIQYNGETGKWK